MTLSFWRRAQRASGVKVAHAPHLGGWGLVVGVEVSEEHAWSDPGGGTQVELCQAESRDTSATECSTHGEFIDALRSAWRERHVSGRGQDMAAPTNHKSREVDQSEQEGNQCSGWSWASVDTGICHQTGHT